MLGYVRSPIAYTVSPGLDNCLNNVNISSLIIILFIQCQSPYISDHKAMSFKQCQGPSTRHWHHGLYFIKYLHLFKKFHQIYYIAIISKVFPTGFQAISCFVFLEPTSAILAGSVLPPEDIRGVLTVVFTLSIWKEKSCVDIACLGHQFLLWWFFCDI